MDWSENNLCIKCNEGTDLLVCSETDCPLSIHEKCMSCPARFDDSGRFYCPYCLYKKAVAESRQAREYALAKKKALLVFMEEDVIVGEQQPLENEGAEANNGHNDQSKVNETNVNVTALGDEENKVSGAENEKIPEEVPKISDEEEIRDEVREEASEASNSRDKKIPEEEIENSSGSSGLDSVPLRKRAKSALKRRKTVHKESEAVLAKKKSAEQSDGSKNPSPNVNSVHKKTEAVLAKKKSAEQSDGSKNPSPNVNSVHKKSEAVLAKKKSAEQSDGSKNPSPNVNSVHKDSEAVLAKKKSAEQSNGSKNPSPNVNSPRRSSRNISPATKSPGEVKSEKVEVSKRLRKNELPLVKLLSSGKRKRLMWREEEEEVLKAGVEKFMKEPTSHMPWRKILDMGRNVFDVSRTPIDLKDKWRNMSTK